MSPKGTDSVPGEQLPETLAEVGPAVEGQRSGGQPVEGVLGEEDPRTLGGLPRELDG